MKHKKDTRKREQVPFREGQRVALRISGEATVGFIAVIDGTHEGILYKNEVFQPLEVGQEIGGFIKKVRDDQKIDLCLQRPGYNAIDTQSQKIMDKLQHQGGFIAATDKTRPRIIAEIFGVSKKTFKKSIGNLYKRRLITLEKDGIRLRGTKEKPRKPLPKERRL